MGYFLELGNYLVGVGGGFFFFQLDCFVVGGGGVIFVYGGFVIDG